MMPYRFRAPRALTGALIIALTAGLVAPAAAEDFLSATLNKLFNQQQPQAAAPAQGGEETGTVATGTLYGAPPSAASGPAGPQGGAPVAGSAQVTSPQVAALGVVPLPPPKPRNLLGPGAASPASAAAAPRLQQVAQQGAAAMPAAAPDGRASPAMVQRIMDYYNSVQSMTGTFTQIDPDGSRRTGDFYMQKPGRVRFQYDPPSPVELIANGQSVAVRDRKLNTQDITPLGQTPLRFLLAEHVDLANDPHVTGIFQDDRFVTVTMQEQVPMLGTYRLLIQFDTKTSALKQWVVTDPQGYDTQVTLANAQVNKRPDPSLFVINFERMLQ
ncbi:MULTISPECIES: LolA family protein [unclassified Xanthobacter]|uniref:LolA family protein n=1 Tax=unclassified Xanthobacter TaxID=2623496 RepID=UPI001EDD4ADB|nr:MULTISPECIES: outer-membrane lipoprotein carrier protein LolA [unclassified Xanthobacter]